jgi:hypothetical protein
MKLRGHVGDARTSLRPASEDAAIPRRASLGLVRAGLTVFKFVIRAGGERTSRRRVPRRVAAVWLPDELETELTRSRRYGRTFALVRVPSGAKTNARPTASIELGQAISSLVRSVDRVWSDAESVYLLLPEGDQAMSEAMLTRLRQSLAELLSADEQDPISVVVFPHDGVTRGALLNALERSVRTRRSQLPRAPSFNLSALPPVQRYWWAP